MTDQPEFVWMLFRDAIIALSLTPEEQRRVNGPGLACDLLNDFDHAQRTFVAHFGDALTSEQRNVIDKMKLLVAGMQADDTECFNDDAVRRQIWQHLRESATDGRRLFALKMPSSIHSSKPNQEYGDGPLRNSPLSARRRGANEVRLSPGLIAEHNEVKLMEGGFPGEDGHASG